MKAYDFQVADLKVLAANNYTGLLNIAPGGGKGHPLDEPILAPEGWTLVGNLKAGDYVVGSDGNPTQVLDVYDRGVLDVYRVTFRDGTSVRVDADHLWEVHLQRPNKVQKTVRDTRSLMGLKSLGIYSVPMVRVAGTHQNLPVEPYALGSLLADGSLHAPTPQWTKNNPTVVEEMRRAVEASGGTLSEWRKAGAQQWGVLGLTGHIRDMGLRTKSGGKFIPDEYKNASVAQRLRLVAGLFDGDGSVRSDRGTAHYSSVSEHLIDDVADVLRSLGVGVTKHLQPHKRGNYWELTLHGDFNPFGVSPEKEKFTGTTRRFLRSFKSIEWESREPVRCIRVAADDHLYVTKDYIVTHNTFTAVQSGLDSGADTKLIIAPQSTHESAWGGTVAAVADDEVRVITNKNKAGKTALFDLELGTPGWYVMTPQLFTRMDMSAVAPDMLIVDEAHQLSKAGGKGQRRLSGYSKGDNPIAWRSGMKLALSGTPARNHFERMWALCRMLWPEYEDRGEFADASFWQWRLHRVAKEAEFTVKPTRGGWVSPRKVTKWGGERRPGQLFSELPCVIQHFRRERCCEFHPDGFLSQEEPQVLREKITLLPDQKRAIDELQKQQVAWLDEQPLTVQVPMTTAQRVRQLCLAVPTVTNEVQDDGTMKSRVTFDMDAKSPVLDRMIEILDFELEEDEPVVVYTSSQKFAAVATARFNSAGFTAFEYSGATTATRNDDLAKFGRPGGHRVMVAVIAAAGTGTDGIQRVCSTEFWADRDVDETSNQQTEARADRMGAKGQVQRFIFEDDLGYSAGRMEKQLNANRGLTSSLRVK